MKLTPMPTRSVITTSVILFTIGVVLILLGTSCSKTTVLVAPCSPDTVEVKHPDCKHDHKHCHKHRHKNCR